MNGTVRAVALIGARNVLKSVRTPMLITASLIQPIIWLVLFSQTFKALADTPQFRDLGYTSYLTFLVPGMIVLSILFTALQSGMGTVTDLDTGMMDKFLISPIRRFSILLGRVAADAVTMVIQGAIVLAIALLMGASVESGWLGALVMLGLATLFGVVWASLSNLIALRTRNSEMTMVAGLLLTLPALFLSPAFFPKPLQPGWLQVVADWNPAAYVIESGQRLMSAGSDWGLDLRTLGVVVGTGLVLVTAAVASFRAVSR
jgi:ABC-2 type transport system permease protein